MRACAEFRKFWGFVHLMREFKADDWRRIVHRVDASACRAIMLRRGMWWTQTYHRQISVGSRSCAGVLEWILIEFHGCDASSHPCLSIQRGRTEKAPDKTERIQRRRVEVRPVMMVEKSGSLGGDDVSVV